MPRNETKNDIKMQLAFYEGLMHRTPKDVELLKVMGDLYTKIGEHQKSLEIDRKLARLLPHDSMIQYNLACSYALLRESGKAIKCLIKAIKLGYTDWDWIKSDPDLKSLRDNEKFKDIFKKMEKSPEWVDNK